jgi:hypothetical protein
MNPDPAGDSTPRLPVRAAGLWREVAWASPLLVAFTAVVLWFNVADFYHRNFFDHGVIVFVDNLIRIAFLLVLAWTVYAPGAAAAALLFPETRSLSTAERAVLGFAIGAGLWHVLMMILGVARLYYPSIMIGIVAVVLLASCRHFAASCRTIQVRDLSRGTRASIVMIAVAGIWLLLVQGLYPGGGGDYYTHYFYFNLEVIRSHELAPNDVWYHYYYSKGYGLVFLGMLLTDPEAPALVTYLCVIFAAVAMAVLANRIAPGSLWPGCVAGLYLLFNLVCVSGRLAGHFQKGHEPVAAFVVLMAVALCMARGLLTRAWMAMAASSGVAVAIMAQPFGAVLALYFAGWAMLRRKVMWQAGLTAAAIGGTVAAMLALNYWETGLANDQGLEFLLRFANIERLDRWGVLPQIITTAWIRDNYAGEVPGWGFALTTMPRYFLRLDQLWVFLAMAGGLLLVAARQKRAPSQRAAVVIGVMGSLAATFAAIGIVAGRPQPGSFERASSFFFPLLMLLAMAVCIWGASSRRNRQFRDWMQPALLTIGTLLVWAGTADWPQRLARASDNGLRFFTGRYSLAEAYVRQDGGYELGGINPQALAAWRQVPPGTVIWATTVYAYCMVPNCWMESVFSFKLSGKLDEILTAPPQRSKELLQAAGINYFLVLGDASLDDLLPYSPLFSRDTIGDYLNIKWTDGSAFLLTWKAPDTTPLTPEFYKVYDELLRRPEHPWFKFSQLVPYMPKAMASLRAKEWGEPAVFPWRVPSLSQAIPRPEEPVRGNHP